MKLKGGIPCDGILETIRSSQRTARSDLAMLERHGFIRKERGGKKNYYRA